MTRRGHHEGSIYKRSDGRWAATVTLGYEGSKRIRKTFYGETRKEVQEQLTKALSDLQQGLPLPNERLTVGAFLTRWLEESIRPAKRPTTYASYAQIVRLYLQPELGRKMLAKLTAPDVQALINHMLEAGMAPRTVQYTHALLRAALNKAVRWGLIARNVTTLVDAPGPGQQEMRFLSPEEARSFLEAIRGDRLEALYTVALAIGLRPGEALGLRWQDVDLVSGVLRVQVALQRIKGKLELDELKTHRSRRSLALPQFTNRALKAHRAHQEEERQNAGDRWEERDLVFCTRLGRPLLQRNVIRSFRRTLKYAGLTHRRFYDLRHTCASLLLVQGVHPRVVMEILGHSQISLTMNTYSHVVPELQQDAAQRMDSLFADGAATMRSPETM